MKATTRIGYLFSTYPVFEQTFMWREVSELRRNGIDVRTFSLRVPGDHLVKSAEEEEERRNTFYLRKSGVAFIAGAHFRFFIASPVRFMAGLVYALRLTPAGLRSLLWQFFYFVEAVCLLEWARKNKIKHVHAHMVGSACSVALIAAKCGTMTFSLTAHGQYMFDNCDTWCLTEKFTQAEIIICISDYCRSQVMRQVAPVHWNKLHVVRVGVDAKRFAPKPERESGKDRVSLLYVGRLAPGKGQHLLVQACAEIKRRGICFQCAIVGEGPDASALRQLISDLNLEDCVLLTGGLGEGEVRRFYENADIFVMPSLAEGVPVVLMEAMAMTLPVVSTRVMGVPELVDDDVSGLLVRPGCVEELANAIAQLANDPAVRSRLGNAGRQKVLAEYNIEANVAKLAQIMQCRIDQECADKEVAKGFV